MQKSGIWIRIAGHAHMIRAGGPHPWRCYIQGNPDEIPLKDWILSGDVSRENCRPGSKASGDQHGLVAWVDCFGTFTINDEILHIVLANPGD